MCRLIKSPKQLRSEVRVVDRVLLEVQITSIVAHPGRLYDLIHALVEESYRQSEAGDPLDADVWRRLGMLLTAAEQIAQTL